MNKNFFMTNNSFTNILHCVKWKNNIAIRRGELNGVRDEGWRLAFSLLVSFI